MSTFIPAPGHVEIEPIKQEGIIIDPDRKYEVMGKVIALSREKMLLDNELYIEVGDTIFFDDYAYRATPEIDGVRHCVVNITDGLLGIIKNVCGEKVNAKEPDGSITSGFIGAVETGTSKSAPDAATGSSSETPSPTTSI